MHYHELIRRIKDAAHADDSESQDALELVVENVAAHLTDHTRREFAAALPTSCRTPPRWYRQPTISTRISSSS